MAEFLLGLCCGVVLVIVIGYLVFMAMALDFWKHGGLG